MKKNCCIQLLPVNICSPKGFAKTGNNAPATHHIGVQHSNYTTVTRTAFHAGISSNGSFFPGPDFTHKTILVNHDEPAGNNRRRDSELLVKCMVTNLQIQYA